MKEIIATHGWAGDSHQWSNWEKIFKSYDWEWQTSDRDLSVNYVTTSTKPN